MKDKNERNKKQLSIYFSDAINQIDESIDYNEKNEVNTSGYIKNSLCKAEDEIEKMISSPIMTNYRRYNKEKISLNVLKKNKDAIIKKVHWLIENNIHKKGNLNKNKNIYNSYSMTKRILNVDKDKLKTLYNKEVQEQKNNLKSVNILPKIKSSNTIDIEKIDINNISRLIKDKKGKSKDIILSQPGDVSQTLNVETINNIRNKNKNNSFNYKNPLNFIQKDIKNNFKSNNLNYNSNKQFMKNLFKEIESLKTYEEKDSQNLQRINSHRIKKNKKLRNKMIKIKDIQMRKFLRENIHKLKEDKNNKEAKIMKDFIQLKLKKDPIVQLSEKFAYFNRKPLLSLFHYDIKKNKIINGPLAKLKVKDKKILNELESDNKTKDLLIKRLDEDQEKYTNGGYFFGKKEKDNNINNNILQKGFNSNTNENSENYLEEFNFTKLNND